MSILNQTFSEAHATTKAEARIAELEGDVETLEERIFELGGWGEGSAYEYALELALDVERGVLTFDEMLTKLREQAGVA